MSCAFCNISPDEIIIENEYSFAKYDKYPVNLGHVLIIPKRHFANYFDSTHEEKLAILDLVDKCKTLLDKKYYPDGYNIGINCGQEAGQTIFHLHIHLIPRYVGDIKDPTGGVRGVIPHKRIYEKTQ